MGVWQCLLQVNEWWEAVQVELHGQYSVPRLTALRAHCAQTSLLRATAVALLTPVPCLAIVLAMDVLPLAPAEAGLAKQTFGFWLRTYVTCWLFTFMAITLVCEIIPVLPMSRRRLWCISLVISGLLILTAYGFILVIGFPVPFAIQLDTGPYIVLLGTAAWFSWKDTLRADKKTREELVRYLKIFQAQVVIILVYTAYNVTFTQIGRSHQAAFSTLLPPIKMIFKNWVSAGLVHLEDLAPTIVVFNVDVFHSLYVSLAMQQSLTPGAMFVIMGVDIAQSMIAYYEIHKVVERVYESARMLASMEEEPRFTHHLEHVGTIDVFTLAAEILESNPRVREHPDVAHARHIVGVRRRSSVRRSWNKKFAGGHGRHSMMGKGKTLIQVRPYLGSIALPTVAKTMASSPQALLTPLDKCQLNCVQDVLKLLHMSEFYVLIEYAEVMMATLYAVYLSVLSCLPNRIYYTQLSRLSEHEMRIVASRVLLYAFLELVSYVLLCVALGQKLTNFSPTRQLAFAVQSHWRIILSTFIVWTFATVQFSLEHYGADYTFKFKWLHREHMQ